MRNPGGIRLSSSSRALRSQPTRDRILAAARRVFAAEGYERATVRSVAAEADTNPAMVIRYFGTKEGLFASAIRFDLRLPNLADLPREEVGERLVTHFLARWEGKESKGELQALLRAGVSHAAAREKLVEIFQGQLTGAIASLCGASEAGIRAGLIASQMLGLALGRYILALPDLVNADPATLAQSIGATIQRYLTEP